MDEAIESNETLVSIVSGIVDGETDVNSIKEKLDRVTIPTQSLERFDFLRDTLLQIQTEEGYAREILDNVKTHVKSSLEIDIRASTLIQALIIHKLLNKKPDKVRRSYIISRNKRNAADDLTYVYSKLYDIIPNIVNMARKDIKDIDLSDILNLFFTGGLDEYI